MRDLEIVNNFEMFACALVYIKAAAEAGGTIDTYQMEFFPFENMRYAADVFFEKFLAAFGEVQPPPTPEEEARIMEDDNLHFTQFFTLNEKGWKIAEQIKAIQEATEGMVPSQEQVDQWMHEEFDYRNSDEYLE